MWAWLDALTCLILVILVAIAPPPKPPTAPTLGFYAVVVEWPARNQDDVDMYVRDPGGQIAYFNSLSSPDAVMHLEHDDLGAFNECVTNPACLNLPNQERTIIRQVVPGQFAVDVHMYLKNQPGSTPVTVTLWSLASGGAITTTHVMLTHQAQVDAAFQFTLNKAGKVVGISHLPIKFVTQ